MRFSPDTGWKPGACHFVCYILHSVSGELLYIGRSFDPKKRLRRFKEREGLRDCVLGLSQRFTDFDEACAAELAAILKHRPPYNKRVVSCKGFIGMKHSKKTLEDLSAISRARGVPPQALVAAAQAKKAQVLTAEQRARISAAAKARKHRPHTQATKDKIREAHLARRST